MSCRTARSADERDSDGDNATQRGKHHGETQRRDAGPNNRTDEQYLSAR